MAVIIGLDFFNNKQVKQTASALNVPIINNGVSIASIIAAIKAK